ncbi:hypothetical protein HDV02_003631 [Globomyces sp. JEL0801]|nr:hypothetical protein HDV02_003631 [Globomyces sp. JEL0801]
MSIDQLQDVIINLLQIISNQKSSTEDINKAATTLATECFTLPLAIPSLIKIVSSHPSQHIRQLGSVEVRKLIQKNEGMFWESVPVDIREDIKANILNISILEESTLVRHSLAHVISAIAKNELHLERWSNLVEILYNSCSSNEVIHREMGVYILYTLFEVIADKLESFLGHLLDLFSKTIHDHESLLVGVTTVQALGKLADFIDLEDSQSIKKFQNLVPAMVSVLQKCLSVNDDESTGKILEVFDSILLLETPLLAKHFVDLIHLFLQIALSHDHQEDIRIQSLTFLMWCIMSARTKIGKAKLIPSIVSSMVVIASEEEPDNRDEDYPAKLAVQVINTLALNFPPQQVFPEVMQQVMKFIQSSNAHERKGAILCLAVLFEGCADYMRPNVNDVLQLVTHSLQDPDSKVRRAACMALGALCDDFEDEMAAQHAVLLPLLFNLINDSDTSVHPEALSTLDVLIERLGDDILPYMQGVMDKFCVLLEIGTRKVQITTTNCIGSVAFAASQEFIPFFPGVISRFTSIMMLNALEDVSLRAVATDAVGAVATAVGKDVFRPHLPQIMELAIQGMQLDQPQLNQCSYVLFGVLGRLFGDEFTPYVQVIVPHILASCKGEEDIFKAGEEDIGDEEQENTPGFSTGVAQEKESSIDTLGELFEATRLSFLPFVPETIHTAINLLQHYHDGVRIAASGALLKIFNTMYLIGDADEWEPGLPLKKPLHENVSSTGKLVIEAVLMLLAEEDDRYVVTQILQQFSDTLKITGPAAMYQEFSSETAENGGGSHLDAFATQLLLILQNEHPCQSLQDSYEDEGEDDIAELDALVISAAADTVGALSAAIGSQFAKYFQEFFPLISKLFKKNKPLADRSLAIGSIAEIVDGLESGVTPFTNDLFNFFMRGLQDPEDEVKSNACFGIGALITNTTADITGMYDQVLVSLRPLFNPNSNTNMQDNACGCVCRMILKQPTLVPLDQALPVILSALPLTKDYAENRPIFKCLVQLLNDRNAIALKSLQALDRTNFEALVSQLGQEHAMIIINSIN